MRRLSVLILAALMESATIFGQAAPTDSQLTQTLLTEIRQLRQDLQATAATIQRVQIVMYRVQTQASLLSRATERLNNTRPHCGMVETQKKRTQEQIEHTEAERRSAPSTVEQKAAEGMLAQLRSTAEMWADQEGQCRIEQTEAETQFRTEQAKMNELQDQLDKLDQILASRAGQP